MTRLLGAFWDDSVGKWRSYAVPRFLKAYLFASVELVTFTFDLEMVFGEFYTELGSWLKKYPCFELIWIVNLHTVRDKVWK